MRQLLTISELNTYIKNVIHNDPFLSYVEVRGEIINLKRYHTAIYFTLKEGDKARLSVVTFNTKAFPATLKDGDEVIAAGRISVYEKSGNYQLVAHDVSYYGLGAKLIELAKLKVKLDNMGLFAPERKRPLPKFPKVIGIITPKDSAAQSDLITNINRRYPLVTLKLVNATFQGESAPESLINAFNILQKEPIDLLIIARGGGSSDDLWAFNDERLIMALSQKKVPLISAIGHEIDTTLVDYLADVRASTPTAAAELAVPDQNELRQTLTDYNIRLENAVNTALFQSETMLTHLTSRPVLVNFGAVVDNLTTKLLTLSTKLGARSAESLTKAQICLQTLKERLNKAITRLYNDYNEVIVEKRTHLAALNPTNILNRGYAFISRKDEIIKSAKALNKGDEVTIKFSDGSVTAEVKGGEDE